MTALTTRTGRGYGSGGVSVDDDSLQEIGKEHVSTVETSPTPRDTTGVGLVEAAETLERKTRTKRPTDIEPAS